MAALSLPSVHEDVSIPFDRITVMTWLIPTQLSYIVQFNREKQNNLLHTKPKLAVTEVSWSIGLANTMKLPYNAKHMKEKEEPLGWYTSRSSQ